MEQSPLQREIHDKILDLSIYIDISIDDIYSEDETWLISN